MTTTPSPRRTDLPLRRPPRRPWTWVAAVVLTAIVAALLTLAAVALQVTTYDKWAVGWIAPTLLLLTLIPIRRISRSEDDPGLVRFLLLAATLKIVVGSCFRWVMVYVLYNGVGDSAAYHDAGAELAPLFRSGTPVDLGEITGTRSIEVFTGLVYSIVGRTRLGGFMIFSWLGFLGLLWFYRAFRIAFPNVDPTRYRLLLFLLPTNWFWPSSIGKDALMVGALGLASLGVAHLLAGNLRGLVPFGLGAWGAAVVRPHLTLILAVGLAFGMVVRVFQRRTSGDAREVGMLRRLVGLAAVVVCVMLVVPSVETTLGIPDLSPDSTDQARTDVNERTSQGETQYDGFNVSNPAGFALGAVSVLFRPLPTDVKDGPTALACLEVAFLLYLIWRWRDDVYRNLTGSFRTPYLAFCVGYVLCFCYAFSAIFNLGIIARQRAQVLPLVLVLMAASIVPKRQQPTDSGPRPRELALPHRGRRPLHPSHR